MKLNCLRLMGAGVSFTSLLALNGSAAPNRLASTVNLRPMQVPRLERPNTTMPKSFTFQNVPADLQPTGLCPVVNLNELEELGGPPYKLTWPGELTYTGSYMSVAVSKDEKDIEMIPVAVEYSSEQIRENNGKCPVPALTESNFVQELKNTNLRTLRVGQDKVFIIQPQEEMQARGTNGEPIPFVSDIPPSNIQQLNQYMGGSINTEPKPLPDGPNFVPERLEGDVFS